MISTLQDLLGELREVTLAKLLETCHSQSMCNNYLLEEGKLHGLWNVGLRRAEPARKLPDDCTSGISDGI